MATPRTEYYNFTQVSNLGALQPIGYGPFPVDNSTGFTTLKFTGLNLVTAREPQQYVQPDNHLNVYLFDPADPTKYATYKTNPIATGTAADPGTSTFPSGGVSFTDGDYSLSLDASDWNLYGGLTGLTDGLVLGFYSNASNAFPTTSDCPNAHLSSVDAGYGRKYWSFECPQYATGVLKYSKDEMVEKYANSIDSCPIFADRSTKDANGDTIDTTYLKSANASKIEKVSTSLPPVYTPVAEFKVFTDGRVRGDASDLGVLGPAPSQSDSGKILEATWAGSPAIGTARWVAKPTGVPASVVSDEGKVLTVNGSGEAEWQTPVIPDVYNAGDGLTKTRDLQTGEWTFAWQYTVGRNLHINQNDAIQTNLPGGTFNAPASQSNDFERLNGADFAGAFRLACRHNTSDNYELAIAYTASGMSSSYSFIGTETIVATDNSVTTKQAVYLGESCYYTPTVKFGGYTSTAFDPTRHKAIIYDGIGQIGPTSDCKIAIYSDANSNVKIAFTAIEVGKVGSTT